MSPNDRPTVWQIAGGPQDRSYADQFLKHGVALIGPGDAGKWNSDRDDSDFEGGYVRRFASEVKVGDVFLLRIGRARVRAVGKVAGGYEYFEQFDDVNGWDLQHGRRVRWLPIEQEWAEQPFGANPTRLSRTQNPQVIEFALNCLGSEPSSWRDAPLPPLPLPPPPLVNVPEELADLVAKVLDLSPLYRDAETFGPLPSEDELIAHLIVPFFEALGWPTPLIGVKWEKVDVVLFSKLPRSRETVKFVVEAKRLGAGIEGALEQAKSYVNALGVKCDVVVTDGIRYRLYSAQNDFAPVHYASLALLKEPALGLFNALRRASD